MNKIYTPSVFCYKSSFCHISFLAANDGIFKVSFIKSGNRDNGYDFSNLSKALDSYFAGRPTIFNESLIYKRDCFGGKVLSALLKVPFGKTVSYSALAKLAGSPRAARAVGSVMSKNDLPLLIPCHRVIASNGALGGYGPGINIKVKLLALEGATEIVY